VTSFPIVGIGASAGGLEAVSELLAGLPSANGMAFIVVQHLDPDHESLLSEILAKRTRIALAQARDGMLIEPDHIYVIPPAATLTLEDDHLRLTPRVVGPERFMPVDALFRSLANARGESAIGVVLSGADADGALGLQAIKHSGGITFAQDPACARFPTMPAAPSRPAASISCLRPDQIAHELTHLAQHPYLRSIAAGGCDGKPAEATEARDEESLGGSCAGCAPRMAWTSRTTSAAHAPPSRAPDGVQEARRACGLRRPAEGDPSEATLYPGFRFE
jgi:two-component system CheB/CheR fusion protein